MEHHNRLAGSMVASNGNGNTKPGTVTPFGDNPSLSALLQASLSENSALPPFLRNLVSGPLSRSTSASPQQRSPSLSPTQMRGKYSHSADEEENLMHEQDDYPEEYEDDCDLMDEVQDLRVSSKTESPSERSRHCDIRSEIVNSKAHQNGLVSYKETEDDMNGDHDLSPVNSPAVKVNGNEDSLGDE